VLQVLVNLFGLTSKVLGFNFLVSSFIRLNLSSYKENKKKRFDNELLIRDTFTTTDKIV
jgi:hypothetical protein